MMRTPPAADSFGIDHGDSCVGLCSSELRAVSSAAATSPGRGLGRWPRQPRPPTRMSTMRDTGNTLAAESGTSLGELMNRMGHSSARAARIYLDAREERNGSSPRRWTRWARREMKASAAKRTAGRSGA